MRALEKKAGAEQAQAHRAVVGADHAYRARISQAQQKLVELRASNRGERVGEPLGQVTLYEHAIVCAGEPFSLAGLRSRLEPARSAPLWYLYLTPARDGLERSTKFAADEHSEEEIRNFATAVHNQIVREDRLQALREEDIRAAEVELQTAQENTGPLQAARERREALNAQHRDDQELPKAQATLEEARDVWEQRTGRRPW